MVRVQPSQETWAVTGTLRVLSLLTGAALLMCVQAHAPADRAALLTCRTSTLRSSHASRSSPRRGRSGASCSSTAALAQSIADCRRWDSLDASRDTSGEDIRKRLSFALGYAAWTEQQWAQMLFSDE